MDMFIFFSPCALIEDFSISLVVHDKVHCIDCSQPSIFSCFFDQ